MSLAGEILRNLSSRKEECWLKKKMCYFDIMIRLKFLSVCLTVEFYLTTQQTNTADMLDLAVDYIKDLQKQAKVRRKNEIFFEFLPPFTFVNR